MDPKTKLKVQNSGKNAINIDSDPEDDPNDQLSADSDNNNNINILMDQEMHEEPN